MSPVSLGSFVLIFLSSGARIAPSATGMVYDLPVRVSFISSALPDGAAADGLAEFPDGAAAGDLAAFPDVAATGGLAELLAGAAGAGLAVFFLDVAGGADEPVFGIQSPVDKVKFSANADAGDNRATLTAPRRRLRALQRRDIHHDVGVRGA